MWVVFEGLDKSGKGTLELEFLKATNFKHIVIDRGPAGYLTFDCLFERRTNAGDKQYARNAALMSGTKDFVVVYCKAPVDVVMKRLEEHNEVCPYNYEFAQEIYDVAVETMYSESGVEVILVDTTKSIKECTDLIINKFQEVLKRNEHN